VSGGSTTTDNEDFIRRLSDHMLTYTDKRKILDILPIQSGLPPSRQQGHKPVPV
jgi:hypothetical protein